MQKKPLFLAGGGINVSNANSKFTELVEKTKIPVVTTIMGRGSIPTKHNLYFGNLGMHGSFAANKAIQECDLLFSIGTRFNDRIAGNIEKFAPNAKIVHIDIDPASISRNIVVDVPIVADALKAIEAMFDMVVEMDTKAWVDTLNEWKNTHPLSMKEGEFVTPMQVLKEINERFDNLIVTTDVGQHQMWASQYIDLDENKKLITSGGLGTMGYGLPSAIGASIGCPEKTVVSINGDGGFQMNIQELATAVAEGLPIIIVILNNGYLGMVRQWQGLFFERRYSATCLTKRKTCKEGCNDSEHECPPYLPNFVKIADAYGIKGYTVNSMDELKKAFDKAKESKDEPVIIEVMIERELDVMPMVPSGESLDKMILEVEK